MLFQYRNHKMRSAFFSVFAVGTLFALTLTAYASQSVVQDRRLSMSEAESIVAKTVSDLPLSMNDLVLKELNRFIGTPEGRRQMKNGLARLPHFQKYIEVIAKEHKVPVDMIGIPLFESSFDNASVSSMGSVGIWQIMPATGRRYGLVVNSKRDERVDYLKSTVAAMELLSDLEKQFGSWLLAIKAYNEGEVKVQSIIDRINSKEPWTVERAESRWNYLPGLIASVIVMKNPDLLGN